MKNPVDLARTTPWTMWTDAKHMRVAAEILIAQITEENAKQLILPTMMLVSVSVESALKSFLYASGIDPNRLKNEFRHDLVRLRQEAEKCSDGQIGYLVRAVEPLLDLLNPPYKGKEFQYRVIGEIRVPTPIHLCEWLNLFLRVIKQFVKEKDHLHLESLAARIQSPE